MRFYRNAAMALLAIIVATPAQAQVRSHTQGFQLGFHLSGAGIKAEDEARESGGGVGFSIGYGISRRVLITLDADVARIDAGDEEDFDLGHGDLGVRIHLAGADKAWVPYVTAALSGRVAMWNDVLLLGSTHDVEVSGPAVSFGGGTLYYFSPALALNMGLKLAFGEMNNVRVDGDDYALNDYAFDATSSRLNVGLSWFPSGKNVRTASR